MVADLEPKRYKDTLIFPAALDPDALKIIRRLTRFGHSAYLVGGCVRDLLLGSIPKDFDVATSARPRQIRRLFKNSKVIGRRFKLAHVLFGPKVIEVSTFRKSPSMENPFFESDGLLIIRDNVYGNERDDAVRRDFTINSLFYDVEEEEVVDYTGGVEDIRRRNLRTIGDAKIRFQEDPVRILRAIRFASRLNLRIDESVYRSMIKYSADITRSAPQRVTEEVIRLMSCGASRRAVEMMMKIGLFGILFPEFSEVLDQKAHYFNCDHTGRELLLRLLDSMDRADKGKRRFGNPMFLVILFCHMGGRALHLRRERMDAPVDPGAVLNEAIRPIAMRMGISRRDLSRIKQIIIAYPRLEAPKKKRRRFKPRELARRDYFPDALEFFRQVNEAKEGSLERYNWWLEQRSQRSPARRGTAKPQGRRKRRKQPKGHAGGA